MSVQGFAVSGLQFAVRSSPFTVRGSLFAVGAFSDLAIGLMSPISPIRSPIPTIIENCER
jgi:hypothetical protein